MMFPGSQHKPSAAASGRQQARTDSGEQQRQQHQILLVLDAIALQDTAEPMLDPWILVAATTGGAGGVASNLARSEIILPDSAAVLHVPASLPCMLQEGRRQNSSVACRVIVRLHCRCRVEAP